MADELYRATWLYAARMRLGFFFAIVFRQCPHDPERWWECIWWPHQAWDCSRSIWNYHRANRFRGGIGNE